jgi:hypothetical protein
MRFWELINMGQRYIKNLKKAKRIFSFYIKCGFLCIFATKIEQNVTTLPTNASQVDRSECLAASPGRRLVRMLPVSHDG